MTQSLRQDELNECIIVLRQCIDRIRSMKAENDAKGHKEGKLFYDVQTHFQITQPQMKLQAGAGDAVLAYYGVKGKITEKKAIEMIEQYINGCD